MSSVPVSPVPHRKPWEEKSPWVAGILAYLVPGTGHLYQGRYFKGLVYLVCIHGAFFTGLCLGEGMTVHNKPAPHAKQLWQRLSLTYIPQLGNGIWALPAIAQQFRVKGKENIPGKLAAPLTTSFEGVVRGNGPGSPELTGNVAGTLSLKKSQDGVVEGTFTGTREGEPIELELSGGFDADTPIGASPRRELSVNVAPDGESHPNLKLSLAGTIPRPVWDWYAVPPTTPQLRALTGRLGKYFELALVFTWIAGLLNVLAVWDCVKGPSLGFGDEPPAPANEGPHKESAKPVPAVAAEKGK